MFFTHLIFFQWHNKLHCEIHAITISISPQEVEAWKCYVIFQSQTFSKCQVGDGNWGLCGFKDLSLPITLCSFPKLREWSFSILPGSPPHCSGLVPSDHQLFPNRASSPCTKMSLSWLFLLKKFESIWPRICSFLGWLPKKGIILNHI